MVLKTRSARGRWAGERIAKREKEKLTVGTQPRGSLFLT
jgi:hypothetical protein